MRKIRKGLTAAGILLFISVSAIPSFSTNQIINTNNCIPQNLSDDVIGLTPQEAWDLLNDISNGIQSPIDIRTDDEWSKGFIGTPYPEIPVHYPMELLVNEIQKFLDTYNGKEVVLYDSGKGGRIYFLIQTLIEYNFNGTIFFIIGGIIAWEEAGFPIRNNTSPDVPRINGPLRVKVGKNYDYSFLSEDPDGDNISYYIDWSDGNITDWTLYVQSGIEILVSHTWSQKGVYLIKAKAKDVFGAESDWGTPPIIIVPKSSNVWFQWLLDWFPLLNWILKWLIL